MCIFCKIAEGQIPAHKIYEDDLCLAFLDLSQANIGHSLVVPKKHFSNILELDEQTSGHLFKVVTKLTKGISKALDVYDFNILNNCGEVAGQTVHHFHIHIIPRKSNDSINIELGLNKLTDEQFINLKKEIVEHIK